MNQTTPSAALYVISPAPSAVEGVVWFTRLIVCGVSKHLTTSMSGGLKRGELAGLLWFTRLIQCEYCYAVVDLPYRALEYQGWQLLWFRVPVHNQDNLGS